MRHLLHSFIPSKKAKTNHGAILILMILVGAAVYGYTQGWFSGLNLPFSVQSGGGSGAGVSVDRKLEISFTNKYTGAQSNTKTFYIYEGSPAVLVETGITAGSGAAIFDTADKYQSGTQLWIKYVDGNAKIWYSVVVPKMATADANSNAYNSIDLQSCTAPATFAETLQVNGQNALENYTIATMSGNKAPVFVYQITNTGADNTGFIDSNTADPVYGDTWGTYLVATISGTGYETVIPSGFDQVFTIGQTTYGVIRLSNDMLSKWKTGNTYQPGFAGGQTVTFSLDLTGYSGSGASMNVYVYAYCDPAYAQTHGGNFGGDKISIVQDGDTDNAVSLIS